MKHLNDFNNERNDFKEFIDNRNYYVDKTPFIKEVLPYGNKTGVKVILLPKHFGKTLNMSMLRYFFDIEEKKNSYLFNQLKISNDQEFCNKHQNKYPVIFLSFKDVIGKNLDEMILHLNLVISKEYKRHAKTMDTMKIINHPWKKKAFESLMKGKADLVKLMHSISYLEECLKDFYQIKPILLIDDFDAPACSAYYNGYSNNEVSCIIDVLFSAALKDSLFCHAAVISGTVEDIPCSIFDRFNIATYDHVLTDYSFSGFFGFTDKEVDDMLLYYNLTDRKGDINVWCGGYNLAGNYLYDPYAVCFFISKSFENPNICFDYIDLKPTRFTEIKEIFNYTNIDGLLREYLDILINGESIKKPERNPYNNRFIRTEKSADELVADLVFNGFLAFNKEDRIYIPNKRVRLEFLKVTNDFNISICSKTFRVFLEKTLIEKNNKVFEMIIGTIQNMMIRKIRNDIEFLRQLTSVLIKILGKDWTTNYLIRSDDQTSIVLENSILKKEIFIEIEIASSVNEMDQTLNEIAKRISHQNFTLKNIDEDYEVICYALCLCDDEIKTRLAK